MPLRCTNSSGETLLAFTYGAESWKALSNANREDKHLAMPCCGRQVVVKTSHAGTRFFAHARRADFICPAESEDHLLAKEIVAKAALSAGWQAETEVLLQPQGAVADVLASSGKRRVAFEIQCSGQNEADTKRRHRTYERAGVRALWLFKQAGYPRWKEVPAFRIVRAAGTRVFDVWVWREGHNYKKVSQPAQSVPLDEFIRGALLGRLKWRPAIGLKVPLHAHVSNVRCRRGHQGPALRLIEFGIEEVLPGHASARVSVQAFNERPEVLRTPAVRKFLEAHGLALHFGVSNWTLRRYQDNFHRYVYASCSTCGELIGQSEIGDSGSPRVLATGHSVRLSEEYVDSIPGLSGQLSRWWFAQ